MKINEERLLNNLKVLKSFTDTPGNGVTRFSYGDQDNKAREFILKRAEAAGCSITVDPLRNIRIGLPSNRPGRKSVIAGSHVDTVKNGGWLDGIYGVCGALEVMETLCGSAASGSSCNYEMVIFAEEEGSNFGSTMTGSKFISGKYGEADLDRLQNDDGVSLRNVLEGLKGRDRYEDRYLSGDISDIANIQWNFDSIKTMLELHIEQGPVLDREGLSLGVVDYIFGMRVIEVTLTGVGNHAGATPMNERYDAMCAAAQCILEAESIVKGDADRRTVVTVGKADILPGCSNVIPEKVTFTLEIRDRDQSKIDSFMNKVKTRINAIARERGVGCLMYEHSSSSPLRLSERLISSMKERAASRDLAFKVMDSGAVHDACMIAEHADTGMIFVPSINGRSHVPQEDTDERDLAAGAQFLLDTVISELDINE